MVLPIFGNFTSEFKSLNFPEGGICTLIDCSLHHKKTKHKKPLYCTFTYITNNISGVW